MIWKTKRVRRATKLASSDVKRRSVSHQTLERRELLAADPIHVGVVYLETDYLESDNDVGSDSQGDRFLLSFTGGAADTELRQVRIRTDKFGDGISIGDPIFDTEVGGRGKRGAHGFEVLEIRTGDGRAASATAVVSDGGQELVLNLKNFRAGDRLEFSIDVDEVLRESLDLAVFNDRLDVITSGQEFQDSILEAVFEAPHYESATADAIFLNDFGSPNETHGLDLPPDEGNDIDSRANRSAAAIGSTAQVAKPVAISGRVWVDNNLDAVYQAFESGLSGVELSLFSLDHTGDYVDTGLKTTTNASGDYRFPKSLGLRPGTYRVVETQPAGYFSVAAVPGAVSGVSTGVATSTDVLSSIAIPLGDTEAIQMDFAEAAPASIGGFVYHDSNDDGRRSASEQGLAGVQVRLLPVDTIAPQQILTTTTDQFGGYQFQGISPGTYEIIEVAQPVGYVDGKDAAGTVGSTVVGVADNPGDAIRAIALDGGAVGVEYNFGELALASIAGNVFLAAPGQDCDGVHDATGNQPLSGVIVELQTNDGNVLSRITTTPMGEYRFDDVPPGQYRIVQFTPDGYFDGGSFAGTVDGTRSGDAVDGTLIRSITLTPGGTGVEYNFCEVAPAKLSGYVYHDRSFEGRRDPGEEGIAGTTVSLVDDQGNVAATTQTDAAGRYEFTGIEPGRYELREQQPAGFLDGIDSVGMIAGTRVGTAGNDRIRNIDLPQGTEGVEYNFGETLAASLSGSVHADLDGDCIRDANEQGIEGVTIRLLDESGAVVASTQTNAEGIYRFTGITPGRYTVVQTQPEGYFDGGVMVGTEGGVAGVNQIRDVDLGSGVAAEDYDFCEEPPASLSGTVYADTDRDCVHDADEMGIAGVTIELRDAQGDVVATTTTDADGDYRFDSLRAGNYTVHEIQPEGYLQGGQKLGSAGGAVVGVDLMNVTLSPGVDAVDYLFCEYEPASISGMVWADNDQDERLDPGEDPLPGVIVKLIDESGNIIRTTRTDDAGKYSFEGLEPGVYGVCEQQPDGYFHSSQIPGSHGGEVPSDDLIVGIRLGSGDDAVGYHFTELPPASISGFVFVDGDAIETEDPIAPEAIREYRDGVLTSDDRRLSGVTVQLRDADGNALSDDAFLSGDSGNAVVLTSSTGFYAFEGLRPGTYTLFQTQPEAWTDSLDTAGTTGGLAVNAADSYTEEQQQRIESVAGAGIWDAILDVTVESGEASRQNNFSEIEVVIVTPPPEIPPSDFLPTPEPEIVDPAPLPAPLNAERTLRSSFAPIVDGRTPIRIDGGDDFVTWHLSVINGGYPRGAVSGGPVFREVASRDMREVWSEGDHANGEWKMMTIDGKVLEASDQSDLGIKHGIALVGDFNGDGTDETAIFIAGQWFVDLNGNGVWDAGDLWILLGTDMDRPVVGDWDGDGKDDIGIYGRRWERDEQRIRIDAGLPDPSNETRRLIENRKQLGLVSAKLHREHGERWLRRGNRGELQADAVDHVFLFGEDVDTPVSGDWNGDGIDQIGTFRGGQWVLDTEGDGRHKKEEVTFDYGRPGDQPIVGDFDGDGIDEVGVIRGNVWIIDSDGDRQLTASDEQIELPPAEEGSQPIVGDWDGDGRDEPGYYRDAS